MIVFGVFPPRVPRITSPPIFFLHSPLSIQTFPLFRATTRYTPVPHSHPSLVPGRFFHRARSRDESLFLSDLLKNEPCPRRDPVYFTLLFFCPESLPNSFLPPTMPPFPVICIPLRKFSFFHLLHRIRCPVCSIFDNSLLRVMARGHLILPPPYLLSFIDYSTPPSFLVFSHHGIPCFPPQVLFSPPLTQSFHIQLRCPCWKKGPFPPPSARFYLTVKTPVKSFLSFLLFIFHSPSCFSLNDEEPPELFVSPPPGGIFPPLNWAPVIQLPSLCQWIEVPFAGPFSIQT